MIPSLSQKYRERNIPWRPAGDVPEKSLGWTPSAHRTGTRSASLPGRTRIISSCRGRVKGVNFLFLTILFSASCCRKTPPSTSFSVGYLFGIADSLGLLLARATSTIYNLNLSSFLHGERFADWKTVRDLGDQALDLGIVQAILVNGSHLWKVIFMSRCGIKPFSLPRPHSTTIPVINLRYVRHGAAR